MKTSQSRLQEIRRERVEAVIEGRIGALFSRIPALCGFSVEDDLQPADVTVHSWPGYVAGEDLYIEIVATLDSGTSAPEGVRIFSPSSPAGAFAKTRMS